MNEEERRAWSRIVHGERDRARRIGAAVLLAYLTGLAALVGHLAGWW